MTAQEAERLLEFWGPRARRSEAAHYRIAASLQRRHQSMTFAVVALSTLSGSGLFATLSTSNADFKLVLAVMSVLAAALAGLDRSLRYAERAEQHRASGAQWAAIVNKTEEIKASLPAHPPDDQGIAKLEQLMTETTTKAPYIPQKVFEKACLSETYMWSGTCT